MYYAKTVERGNYCFNSDEFKKLSERVDEHKILCYTGKHWESLFKESLVNSAGDTIWSKES